MRITLSALMASTFLAATIVPTMAVPLAHSQLHADHRIAKKAFNHLSDEGQRAMIDVLKAQQSLASNDTKLTAKLLEHASESLNKADKQNGKFVAAMEQLHPRDMKKAEKRYKKTKVSSWIPVGGEFIVTEKLAPSKQAIVKKANALIKAGHAKEAAEVMNVVSEDIDFIVALAPLDKTQASIAKALLTTKAGDKKAASSELMEIVDSVIFVNENTLATLPSNG